MVTEQREESEFNNVLQFLDVLNDIFKTAIKSSYDNNMVSWSSALWCAFRCLTPWMKSEELTYFKERKEFIQYKIYRITKSKRLSQQNNIPNEIYNLLEDYEIKLRRVYKDSGLLDKKKDDAMRSLR